jgi:hypothetical protein
VIPEIQVLENGELAGANGAYATELDQIFVSTDFLVTAGKKLIEAVLLEEVRSINYLMVAWIVLVMKAKLLVS